MGNTVEFVLSKICKDHDLVPDRDREEENYNDPLYYWRKLADMDGPLTFRLFHEIWPIDSSYN